MLVYTYQKNATTLVQDQTQLLAFCCKRQLKIRNSFQGRKETNGSVVCPKKCLKIFNLNESENIKAETDNFFQKRST